MGTQWVSMGTMGLRACFIDAHCRQVFGNLPVMLWSILYTALMHFMTGSTDVAQQMETRNKSRNRSFSPLQLHGWFLPQCHFPALTSNPWFKKSIHPVIVTVIWLRNRSLSPLSAWWPSITHLHWFHFNPSTFSSSHRFHHSPTTRGNVQWPINLPACMSLFLWEETPTWWEESGPPMRNPCSQRRVCTLHTDSYRHQN